MANSNTHYVAIPQDGYTQQYNYYIVPVEPKRRKACGGGCCCFATVLFLLLFFLIPRSPSVYYNSSTISAANSSVSLTQNWNFKNWNFYNIEWKNLELDLYYSTSLLGTYKQVGYCHYNETFTTGSRNDKDLDLKFRFTSATDSAKIAGLCLSGQPIYMLVTGEIDATLLSTTKHKRIGNEYAVLYC